MRKLLYITIDAALLFTGIQSAFILLENLNVLYEYEKNFAAFLDILPYILGTYIFLTYAYGLYNIARKNLSDVIYSVFLLSVSLLVLEMGICFLIRDVAMAFPRSVMLLGGVFNLFLLTGWRVLCWQVERKVAGIKKIAVFSGHDNSLIPSIVKFFSKLYKIEYEYSEKDDSTVIEEKIKSVDEVFIDINIPTKVRDNALFLSIKHKKNVFFVPEYYYLSLISAFLSKTDDIPTFQITSMEMSTEERFIKRFFDLILSLSLIIIFLPFGLFIAALVKLDGGPVFYSQERVTRDRKSFKILKFRTMIPNAEKKSGPVFASENDPRITKVGRFLRAVRFDEVPQLLNILKGEMSVVGPRPERPYYVNKFEQAIPEYAYRHRVKAGLTGLAQVEGKYNTTVENKLRYDLIYINRYSVWRDFLIIIQTIKILFIRESTEGVQ
ncbi:MAG: sugar transferase [Dysgonamonadaceae bacterium]|jgi:exopolysaccharide biosynthesis polyprenyl glycosylphosphotransferase|nr:sugar transferase [Dysgonamonadaceae bacterium]